jgi:hypothetical protein
MVGAEASDCSVHHALDRKSKTLEPERNGIFYIFGDDDGYSLPATALDVAE